MDDNEPEVLVEDGELAEGFTEVGEDGDPIVEEDVLVEDALPIDDDIGALGEKEDGDTTEDDDLISYMFPEEEYQN